MPTFEMGSKITQQTRIVMGMPITIMIADAVHNSIFEEIFSYFVYVDEKFSTYKPTSEILRINRGELVEKDWSDDMKTVMRLCKETTKETDGYFNITTPMGGLDPSGLVKGWAIYNAAELLQKKRFLISALMPAATSSRAGRTEKGSRGASASKILSIRKK